MNFVIEQEVQIWKDPECELYNFTLGQEAETWTLIKKVSEWEPTIRNCLTAPALTNLSVLKKILFRELVKSGNIKRRNGVLVKSGNIKRRNRVRNDTTSSVQVLRKPELFCWKNQYVQPFSENLLNITFDWDDVHKLRGKWIYIVGDSSMRMFFRALIHVIEPELNDPHFGSYLNHDKSGCVAETDGHTGGGCLREYYNGKLRIRITYSFKTFADQPTLALSWLISKSQVPDIILGSTGAWDIYHKRTQFDKSVMWFRNLSASYPSASILAITLVACPPFRNQVTGLNSKLVGALLNQSIPKLSILDRQASTAIIGRSDSKLCEGFHAMGPLVLLHVHAFLANLVLIKHHGQDESCARSQVEL